jgi:ATP-dependent Clp protease ATP-binding subunit ClpA
MFERFTDRARRAVVLAQEESRSFSHNYIGTEHLLLGLIHEGEGVASESLRGLGLTLDMARAEVDQRVGRGSEAAKGHIPFTPRAKTVLELSLREALKLNHKYIGTEHILLGLVTEGQGVAALIMLATIDGGLEGVQQNVLARLTELGDVPADVIEQVRERAVSRIKERRTASFEPPSVEVIARLEAIEARLSAIERLLREQRGEETG